MKLSFETFDKAKEKGIEVTTQDELQSWLRESLIFVEVNVDCTTSPKFCYTIKRFIGNPDNLSEKEWYWDKPVDDDWGLYRIWEDALEAGLKLGLDFI